MTLTVRRSLLGVALAGAAVLGIGTPALAAPPETTDAELSWTLTCDGETIDVVAEAGRSEASGREVAQWTPVFSDPHGTWLLVSEGTATATLTDPDGVVVGTLVVEGVGAQGGPAARKGGQNLRSCLAVAESTDAWSTDGSHLHIELPMVVAMVGRR